MDEFDCRILKSSDLRRDARLSSSSHPFAQAFIKQVYTKQTKHAVCVRVCCWLRHSHALTNSCGAVFRPVAVCCMGPLCSTSGNRSFRRLLVLSSRLRSSLFFFHLTRFPSSSSSAPQLFLFSLLLFSSSLLNPSSSLLLHPTPHSPSATSYRRRPSQICIYLRRSAEWESGLHEI